MLMKEQIRKIIQAAAGTDGFNFDVSYPDPKFGDYATNAGLVLAKQLKQKPQDAAKDLIAKMDKSMFESVAIAGPGFINFTLKVEELLKREERKGQREEQKTLLEYFSPNIAKPIHIGLLRNAMIGDALKRMLAFSGASVESDNHWGDWGTNLGMVLFAYKNYGDAQAIAKNPIPELNKLYVDINNKIEADPSLLEKAKAEFVKLEQGDAENQKLQKQIFDWSLQKFSEVHDKFDIQKFDHQWGESFYEDKMQPVVAELKTKGLLVESQGAQIVNLEDQKLGVAVVVKSDGGTTYLLRDLATFIYRKEQGFTKQLYVVDNRQAHAFRQLFAILKMLGRMQAGEGVHIDYGYISFKGTALATRKGNMILADDVLSQAKEKVARIIAEKNPDIKDKEKTVTAVAKGALKYFDLKHNRHSDIEFDWDAVLDFDGDSGPYLQYAYARLASILRKNNAPGADAPPPLKLRGGWGELSSTERELLFKLSILPEVVEDALKEYLPNILAKYLYELATLINKFYHESPVIAEPDAAKKNFRLGLIAQAKDTLGQGLALLGIEVLEEM